MALIDLHCHLDLYSDPYKVVHEAARRGVYVLSVTTTPSAFLGTRALAPEGSRIRTALGLHPELAASREHELSLFEELLPQTDYVGEVGLDGSRQHKLSLERQGAILTSILNLCAHAGGKTLSIHSRGATKLVLDILEQEPLAGRAVLHWFTGTEREVLRAAEMGCWFSVGFPMLQSEAGRNRVKRMPLDRILPESDGPFGVKGGKPLFPWEANAVIIPLQQTLNIPAVDIETQIASNFRRLSLSRSADV
jgi:TatD DNase family protein